MGNLKKIYLFSFFISLIFFNYFSSTSRADVTSNVDSKTKAVYNIINEKLNELITNHEDKFEMGYERNILPSLEILDTFNFRNSKRAWTFFMGYLGESEFSFYLSREVLRRFYGKEYYNVEDQDGHYKRVMEKKTYGFKEKFTKNPELLQILKDYLADQIIHQVQDQIKDPKKSEIKYKKIINNPYVMDTIVNNFLMGIYLAKVSTLNPNDTFTDKNPNKLTNEEIIDLVRANQFSNDKEERAKLFSKLGFLIRTSLRKALWFLKFSTAVLFGGVGVYTPKQYKPKLFIPGCGG